MNLQQKQCTPCEGGAAPLDEDTARQLLGSIDGWEMAGGAIKKSWKLKNYAEALAWVNAISAVAEAENHHPDVALGWGYVDATLTTHAIGGLSENDFIVAAKIDEAAR